jgi:long-chain acyl-CoA synthetase
LDEVWSGGSHCPLATRDLFSTKFGLPVHTTYGLTEAPSMVTILPKGDVGHAHTSGLALPQLEVRVADDAGLEVPAGETGQITVSAATTGEWAGTYTPMLGYWRRDEASRATVRAGTLYTGDLGRLDEDGYLIVEERQSSVILRGSANVYPAEVERVIDLYPGVIASCVVGVTDPRLGERVLAMVEGSGVPLHDGHLRAHCEANLARYKVPERFIVVERLPRNSMGKVVRPEVLKALEGGSEPRDGSPQTTSD